MKRYSEIKEGDVIVLGHPETVLSITPSAEYPGRCTVVTDQGKFATDLNALVITPEPYKAPAPVYHPNPDEPDASDAEHLRHEQMIRDAESK